MTTALVNVSQELDGDLVPSEYIDLKLLSVLVLPVAARCCQKHRKGAFREWVALWIASKSPNLPVPGLSPRGDSEYVE